MARKRANLTDLLNDLTFKCLFDKFKLICMNEYEWGNLPDGMEERHIERWLFHDGKAIFFRAPGMDYMCLKTEENGKRNVYGDPLGWRAFGYGYTHNCDKDDCVIIENNKLRIPTETFIYYYVNKLTECDRTADVNIKAVKTPVIFSCDDKDVLSFKRIFQQVDGNTPAIFADKMLNTEAIQVYQTGAKFLGNELMDYYHSIENHLLTFLGINNNPVDKKERVNTKETNSNNQLIKTFGELQLESRERACEAINQKYGLDLWVRRRVQPEPVENPVENVESEEE